MGIRCADHATPSINNLTLTSPTSSGRSVGIVSSRTVATEFVSKEIFSSDLDLQMGCVGLYFRNFSHFLHLNCLKASPSP
jgi:hypothetical protein